eukprot:1349769-Rhodomonas_salina.2
MCSTETWGVCSTETRGVYQVFTPLQPTVLTEIRGGGIRVEGLKGRMAWARRAVSELQKAQQHALRRDTSVPHTQTHTYAAIRQYPPTNTHIRRDTSVPHTHTYAAIRHIATAPRCTIRELHTRAPTGAAAARVCTQILAIAFATSDIAYAVHSASACTQIRALHHMRYSASVCTHIRAIAHAVLSWVCTRAHRRAMEGLRARFKEIFEAVRARE